MRRNYSINIRCTSLDGKFFRKIRASIIYKMRGQNRVTFFEHFKG